MSLTITKETKSNVAITNEAKSIYDPTWNEATFTWDEANGTWDNPSTTLHLESKNSVSISNESKT